MVIVRSVYCDYIIGLTEILEDFFYEIVKIWAVGCYLHVLMLFVALYRDLREIMRKE